MASSRPSNEKIVGVKELWYIYVYKKISLVCLTLDVSTIFLLYRYIFFCETVYRFALKMPHKISKF
jgi:hypothetical protein